MTYKNDSTSVLCPYFFKPHGKCIASKNAVKTQKWFNKEEILPDCTCKTP